MKNKEKSKSRKRNKERSEIREKWKMSKLIKIHKHKRNITNGERKQGLKVDRQVEMQRFRQKLRYVNMY